MLIMLMLSKSFATAGHIDAKRRITNLNKPLLSAIVTIFLLFFSTRPAANTTSYLYILEYTGVLMVFHRLGKPSALWTSVGRV